MIEVNLSLGWSYHDYLMILILPTILICSIRQLKYIAPLTIIANILQMGGLVIMFYYIFSSPVHDVTSIPLLGQSASIPLAFGIIFPPILHLILMWSLQKKRISNEFSMTFYKKITLVISSSFHKKGGALIRGGR